MWDYAFKQSPIPATYCVSAGRWIGLTLSSTPHPKLERGVDFKMARHVQRMSARWRAKSGPAHTNTQIPLNLVYGTICAVAEQQKRLSSVGLPPRWPKSLQIIKSG